VAVQAGDNGRRLTRDVEQDRSGGAPIHGAVEDAGEHDDRGGGRDAVGDRQEEGDGGRRSQARQDADRRPDQRPEEAVEEVLRRQRDGEAGSQIAEDLHRGAQLSAPRIPPSPPTAGRGGLRKRARDFFTAPQRGNGPGGSGTRSHTAKTTYDPTVAIAATLTASAQGCGYTTRSMNSTSRKVDEG